MPNENVQINRCLREMETKLGWGSGADWSNYDFEKLSDVILEKTGVNLSITTLKRVWGRLKYPHDPSITTLNTLAAFLGFTDWREFIQQHPVPAIHLPETVQKPQHPDARKRVFSRYLFAAPVFLLVVALLLASNNRHSLKYNPADFSFSADKMVSEGVPNSVVFTYDATKANTDSVYIVQTWDITRKTLVSKNGHHHSAIYYYPGYFRTKLILENEIVKTHDLQITSGGWLALVERAPIPFYFKKNEFLHDSLVEINAATLAVNHLDALLEPPKVRLFNQGDLGDIQDDNFTFQTTLKNTYSEGTNACQKVQVLIQCKDDIIIIPLCAKACIGDESLYAAGKQMVSKQEDLSGFGADLNQWTTLRVTCENKFMSFYVNGKLATSFQFPNEPTGIVGVQYRFAGTCAVKNTWFTGKRGRIDLDQRKY